MLKDLMLLFKITPKTLFLVGNGDGKASLSIPYTASK